MKWRTIIQSKTFRQLIAAQVSDGTEVAPRCPHAGMCGGCSFQNRAYDAQVSAKAAVLNQLWQHEEPVIPVVPSPDPYAYRTRMDYVSTKGRFGLRMRGRWNHIVDLETCHLIPPAAFDVVLGLWRQAHDLGIPDYNVKTHEGFLRYLVVRRSPQDTLLIAAVTAAGAYDTAMAQLAEQALAHPSVVGFHWLLNDSLSDLSSGTPLRHWGAETLPMQVGDTTLHIGPNTFFQNNVHLLPQMLDAVVAAVTSTTSQPGTLRVADLYSGVGLIALRMAAQVGHVVAVESYGESAALAVRNTALNHSANTTVVAEDVCTFLQRQPAGCFDVIVADPPRTGMGEKVCTELLRIKPQRIVTLSCNPLTLYDDYQQLAHGYHLTLLRGYDMFPHTPHVEMLAVLERQEV